jgi:hypothetical protein
VLAWDSIELVCNERGKPVTRWDGSTYRKSLLTGEMEPDDNAQVPVERYMKSREAHWPKADYILGNPPYIGARKIRPSLGEGYVDALRAAYKDVPDTADLVMYWWHKAAVAVASGAAARFGLITTNSIVQEYSRPVLERHINDPAGIVVHFAIPDHPWVESRDGAAVGVAMTVGVSRKTAGANATLGRVTSEDAESDAAIVEYWSVTAINAGLTGGSSAKSLTALKANRTMCFQGIVPSGKGFKLTPEELEAIGYRTDQLPPVLRTYIIGRDLVQRPDAKYIVDFFGLTELESQQRYPELFQHLLTHVKEERETKRGKTKDSIEYANNWWLFAKTRPILRQALAGVARFMGMSRIL